VGRRHPLRQMTEIDLEIDLLDRPGVLDRSPVHFIKARVTHRPPGQIETGVQQRLLWKGHDGAHWHASHISGFSREHITAAVSLTSACAACTVVFAIWVAGRERK